MTIYDLMLLFCDGDDQHIIIWDLDNEKELFNGVYGELNDNELDNTEIMSIDNMYGDENGIVTINI